MALETLSVYCHFGGISILALGLIVGVMDFMSDGIKRLQQGLFIFAIGYAVFKISTKINTILDDEKRPGE